MLSGILWVFGQLCCGLCGCIWLRCWEYDGSVDPFAADTAPLGSPSLPHPLTIAHWTRNHSFTASFYTPLWDHIRSIITHIHVVPISSHLTGMGTKISGWLVCRDFCPRVIDLWSQCARCWVQSARTLEVLGGGPRVSPQDGCGWRAGPAGQMGEVASDFLPDDKRLEHVPSCLAYVGHCILG